MCGDCCCCDDDHKKVRGRGPPHRKNVCCTDIACLVLFAAFLAGMVYIAVYCIMRGDGLRLLFGYDSFGNTCNSNMNKPITNLSLSGHDTSGMGNVLFMDVLDPFDSKQICVKTCPDEHLKDPSDVKAFAETTGSRLCEYDIDISRYGDRSLYHASGPCPSLPIPKSLSVLYRCVPDPSALFGDGEDKELTEAQKDNVTAITGEFVLVINSDELVRKVLSDLYSTWREMLSLCGIAVVISFVVTLLIRFMAAVIVWVVVVLAALGSVAGTGFLWWTYYTAKMTLNKQETLNIPFLDVDIRQESAFLIFSIIATVLTVILLVIILVMRKRFALTVALFHEAGKCVVNMPLLLIQPIWTSIILGLFFMYWVIILSYIGTAGDPSVSYDKDFPSVEYVSPDPVRYMWWYHLAALIWVSEFILACQQFVIAGAVASWYFTRDKDSLSCTISKNICRLIMHHIGSVAFGSLIITAVKIPRYILMYIQAKCKDSENCCAKFCLKCCICCLWCLEKLLKFLNQNAYTIVAMEGKSFCPAAKRAFTIIAENILRVAAINSVGDFVLFLGKIGIMAATCAIAVFWFQNTKDLHFTAVPVLLVSVFSFLIAHCMLSVYETMEGLHYFAVPVLLVAVFSFLIAHCMLSVFETMEGLHYFAVPVLLVAVFSFLIAHCFLSVYEMVVDTLLLCFCEDCAMNDGSEDRDYYMDTSLMRFVKSSSIKISQMYDPPPKAEPV